MMNLIAETAMKANQKHGKSSKLGAAYVLGLRRTESADVRQVCCGS